MSTEHVRLAKDTPARCAVVTVSDTRTEATDASGDLLVGRITEAGHTVLARHLVRDEAEVLRALLGDLMGRVDVVITTGGTGIARRDTTVEVAGTLINKPMPGFGELFRMLSFEAIGPAAMLSRATAGLYGHPSTLLFCLPGSTNAVELAAEKLIVPQLSHLVWELVRQR
jgi:molybdenum cofactor biosynthesis protein B